MSDVWSEPAPRPGASRAVSAARSTEPMAVPMAVFEDFKQHWVGYGAAGFAYFAVAMVLIVVALGLLGLGVAPGLVMQDENVTVVGGLIGMVGYTGLILTFSFVGFPLMSASLTRGLDRQRKGGAPIGVASLFDDARANAGRVVGAYLAIQALALVGMLFLYVPGLIVLAAGQLAMPAIALEEDLTLTDALRASFRHLKANAVWHLATWMILFAVLIVTELTLVGLIFLFPLVIAWQVHAYRAAFGEEGALASLSGD